MWAAPALLAALALLVVLVSLAPASFAAPAIALILAGKMLVEAEFPATASRIELAVYRLVRQIAHRVRRLRPEA